MSETKETLTPDDLTRVYFRTQDADALKRIEYAAVSSIGLLRILEDIDLPGWHSQIVEKCDLLIEAMSDLIVLQEMEKEIHP